MARGRFKKPGKVIAPKTRIQGAQVLERQVINNVSVHGEKNNNTSGISHVITTMDTLQVSFILSGNQLFVSTPEGGQEELSEKIFFDDTELLLSTEEFFLKNGEEYIIKR